MKKFVLVLLFAIAISPDFARPGRIGIDTSNDCDCAGKGGIPPLGQQGVMPSFTVRMLEAYLGMNLFILGIEG